MILAATTPRTMPAFVDSPRLRLFLGTTLYLAQGFPQGIMNFALPSWLAVNGAPASTVGLVAAAGSIPWTVKFLIAGFVDRYAYIAMGRRRGWLVAAQLAIVLTFLAFAILNPEPEQVAVIFAITLILSSATALQDIALDSMVIDLTPEAELAKINAFMYTGKLIGISGGVALIGILIERYSIEAAMLGAMVLFLIPAMAGVLIRERPGEKLLPWTNGAASQESVSVSFDAWLPMLKAAFASLLRRDILAVLVLMICYGFHIDTMLGANILFAANVLNWGEGELSSLMATMTLGSAAVGLVIGGRVVERWGPKAVMAASSLIGAALLLAGALFIDQIADGSAFSVWFLTVMFFAVFAYLSMLVLAMRVIDLATAAIGFNILMAGLSTGMALGSLSIGVIEPFGGFIALYGVSAVFLGLTALCALFLSGSMGPLADRSKVGVSN